MTVTVLLVLLLVLLRMLLYIVFAWVVTLLQYALNKPIPSRPCLRRRPPLIAPNSGIKMNTLLILIHIAHKAHV